MNNKYNRIIDTEPSRLNVALIVGENGTGKSRLLRELAMTYRDQGRPVITVCNTPYDRFSSIRGLAKISASRGRKLPAEVIKRTVISALEDGPTKFQSIGKTLDYCGYRPGFGLVVRGYAGMDDRRLEECATSLKISDHDIEDVMRLGSSMNRLIHDEGRWLDFSNLDFESLINEDLSRLVLWESVFRKAGIIKGVDIYLKRRDGLTIPLAEASSGELTLISTFVFLSVNTRSNSVILIDEPENSLHPQWQKEYVERIANLLYYHQPTIIIATHAPIIVSGARTMRDIDIRLFRAVEGAPEVVDLRSNSVEGTLWQVFRTVTPVNHYVSEQLVSAIADMEKGRISPDEGFRLISDMRDAAYDPAQRPFFDAVRKLAEKVLSESNHD